MLTHKLIAVGVTLAVFIILQIRRGTPVDLLFLGSMVAVTLTGVIPPTKAVQGFSNPAVITIGSLLVVAAALQSTGVLDWVGKKLLGSATSEGSAVRRLAVALVGTSAFLLNTALVAMMVPVVVEWCRRREISPSRLLIPVSYLTILGGVCSMIGTSTTLIVNGILKDEHSKYAKVSEHEFLHGERRAAVADRTEFDRQAAAAKRRFLEGVQPMSLFEIGRVGLPCALVGTGVLILLSRRWLPNRSELIERLEEARREYLVEMMVTADCTLQGQSVQAAGLRELPGLYLIEIDRDGEVVTPVGPHDIIRRGDRLVFAGVVSTIVDLEKIPGLVPAAELSYDEQFGLDMRRRLTEAVLSRSSPLIGTTIKAANFRRRYNAAVVAVHRSGERLTSKIGEIELEPGDTLLLQTQSDFVAQHRNNPDFYLVSSVEGYSPRRHDRALLAGGLSLLLIVWLVLSNLEPVRASVPMFADPAFPAVAALTIAGLLVLTRCVSIPDARRSLNLQVLLTIVGALALGASLEHSGAAADIAEQLVQITGGNHYLLLIVVYLTSSVFTEMITNNAVAAILLPLAVSVAREAQISPRPFVMAIALSASLSFLTPVGYQTNLMVMGPGGYRPSDYLRVGSPVAFGVGLTALLLIPRVWPF